MTTRAATRLEDQVTLLQEKVEQLSELFKSSLQQQTTRQDELENRFGGLEKHVISITDEIKDIASRIPTSSETVCSEEHGHARIVQKPIPFDGSVSWELYKLQFDMLAELNRWDEQDKATHLAISLRGSATGVLTSLQPEKRRDYSALVAALDLRFGMAHQTELNRAKLKNRARKRDETLQELAEDVEKLTRLSYPDAPMAMLDILARDQFLDALQDDLRLRVRQQRPASLHRALDKIRK